jgi:hypothetical protein
MVSSVRDLHPTMNVSLGSTYLWNYARNAPAEVDTDLRRRLVEDGLIPAALSG